MVRRRCCAVSNHEDEHAPSFETALKKRHLRMRSQNEVFLNPHGEERGNAARLEP
jgi:hypothetical protein